MIHAADAAFVDQLAREGDGRHAAIVEPDGIDLAAFARGGGHLFRLAAVHGQRFFAGHDFARFERGDGNIVMGVVGRADIDDADLRIVDDGPPVRDGVLPAPARSHGFDLGFFTAADGLQAGFQGKIEELADLAIGIRMGLAHEFIADHADSDG